VFKIRINSGTDAQAASMGGDLAGYTGTATASTATTLTATGTPFVASAYIGHIVVTVSAAAAYGVITANTTSQLTVDQWYALGTPGSGPATTPTATTVFMIVPGQAPYWYMAISTDTATVLATDSTLTSEITAASSGCLRKLATYAHTTTVASYSLAATFTYTGTDQTFGARTIGKMGIFNTLSGATGRPQFLTLISPTATLTATGDALTVTETVSM